MRFSASAGSMTLVSVCLLAALCGCEQKFEHAQGARASLNIYPGAAQDVGVRGGLGYYYYWYSGNHRIEAAMDFVPDWGNISNFYVTLRGDYAYLLKEIVKKSWAAYIYGGGGAGMFIESETPLHESGVYPMIEAFIGSILQLGKTPLDVRVGIQYPIGAENANLIIISSIGYEF